VLKKLNFPGFPEILLFCALCGNTKKKARGLSHLRAQTSLMIFICLISVNLAGVTAISQMLNQYINNQSIFNSLILTYDLLPFRTLHVHAELSAVRNQIQQERVSDELYKP